jgi:type IV pilus modification protein PilV
MTPFSRRASAGFTLIEALVALVVTAFGMLAVASMQFNMSQGSDIAKQRSEAVRLAQEKIEQLRSFETVASAPGKFDYTEDVVAGCDEMAPASAPCTALVYTSNTRYRRAWTLTRADGVTAADGTDLEKWLAVTVTWTDRTSQAQSVTLRSVISRADPANLGTLLTGPGGTKTRTPKNRNINIPYPAVTLPGDMSAFQPPGASNTNFVFDNVTGDVLGFCDDAAIANARSTNTALSFVTGSVTSGCTAQKGYLLSGYFHFLINVPTGGTEQGRDDGTTSTTVGTKELSAQIFFNSPMPTGHPAAQCFTQRQKVVNAGNITIRNISSVSRTSNVVTVTTSGNHGFSAGQPVAINNVSDKSFNGQFTILAAAGSVFTYGQTGANASPAAPVSPAPTPTATLVQEAVIAETAIAPTGYNSVSARFVAYTCIVQGFDDDSDEGSATRPTPRRWWGQFAITPLLTAGDASVWTLAASGSGNWQVCRFSGDYITDNTISNAEHPLHYRGVRGPLDNQNYLVIPSTENCPNDSEPNPLSDDFINTNTAVHQTASAASGVAPFGGALSTASQWGSGVEDSNTATVIPMICPASGGTDCF